MINQKGTTIAIVGVGASGVACFTQLVAKYIISGKTAPLSICLFEKREEFGPGLAYGTGQEGHLLNTRAGLMGIFPEEPLHFVQWAHQLRQMIENTFGPHRIHPDAYPPRILIFNLNRLKRGQKNPAKRRPIFPAFNPLPQNLAVSVFRRNTLKQNPPLPVC